MINILYAKLNKKLIIMKVYFMCRLFFLTLSGLIVILFSNSSFAALTCENDKYGIECTQDGKRFIFNPLADADTVEEYLANTKTDSSKFIKNKMMNFPVCAIDLPNIAGWLAHIDVGGLQDVLYDSGSCRALLIKLKNPKLLFYLDDDTPDTKNHSRLFITEYQIKG